MHLSQRHQRFRATGGPQRLPKCMCVRKASTQLELLRPQRLHFFTQIKKERPRPIASEGKIKGRCFARAHGLSHLQVIIIGSGVQNNVEDGNRRRRALAPPLPCGSRLGGTADALIPANS